MQVDYANQMEYLIWCFNAPPHHESVMRYRSVTDLYTIMVMQYAAILMTVKMINFRNEMIFFLIFAQNIEVYWAH